MNQSREFMFQSLHGTTFAIDFSFIVDKNTWNLQSKSNKRELGLPSHRQVPLLGYCGLYKINQNKHKTFLLIFYSKYQLLLSQVAFLCSRGVLAVRHPPPPLLWGQRGVNTVCHSDLRKYNSMCGRPRT